MDKNLFLKILESVAEGRVSTEDGAEKLQHMAYEDITYAHIDHHRSLRKGFPEVIFGEGKTADQIAGIMQKMMDQENIILVTRTNQQKADILLSRFPQAVYHADARMIVMELKSVPSKGARSHSDHLSRHFRHTGGARGLSYRQGHGQYR